MFDSIGGLPLHPLVIHAVVVLVPLGLLLAALFAYPRTRAWARWPLGLVALGASVVTFVARQSGQALEAALGIDPSREPLGPLVAQHAQLATQLFVVTIVFAVLAVVAVFTVSPRPLPRGAAAEQRKSPAALDVALCAAVLIVAVLATIWVVRTGDLGARAVWNPAGTIDYTRGG